MRRERALKFVLVLVGLLFCAAIYPLMLMAKQDPALAMMMSLYVTLGVFLLLASHNPSVHRSLIAFTAWSVARLSAPKFPSSKSLQRENSYPQIYPQGTVPTVLFSDLAAPARI